jgi:putative ABC transport system ATP-binding protein
MSNPLSSNSALSAVNLTKTYELGGETIYALRDVSLEVKRGEYVAVMGPSGSGKSTLMHLLGLLDLPDEGEVLIEGKSTKQLNDDDLTYLRRDKLGFVFQTFELIPTLSAKENILLPAEVAGKRNEAEKRCEKIATQLGIAERLNHRPNQLSGGQRQRVAIARSLINDPVVILADEPTGNLDSQTSTEVLELLKRGVKENNWTVIMVTHDPKAAMYADRIIFLEDGKLSGESRTDTTQIHKIIEQFVGV